MKTLPLALSFLFLSLACSVPQPASLATAPDLALTNARAFGGLSMGGQPTESDLQLLAQRGTRRVVNLRKPGEFKDFDEAARAKELGLEYVNLPFGSAEELSDDVLDRARALLREARTTGTLLHCASGNRVGALWLAHRTLDDALAWDEALAEAQSVGLRSSAYIERVKAYVDGRAGR